MKLARTVLISPFWTCIQHPLSRYIRFEFCQRDEVYCQVRQISLIKLMIKNCVRFGFNQDKTSRKLVFNCRYKYLQVVTRTRMEIFFLELSIRFITIHTNTIPHNSIGWIVRKMHVRSVSGWKESHRRFTLNSNSLLKLGVTRHRTT